MMMMIYIYIGEKLIYTEEVVNQRGGQPSRSAATTTFSMEVFDNEVVPSSLQSIAPILRVATEIQNERPRVAYLCNSFYSIQLILILTIWLLVTSTNSIELVLFDEKAGSMRSRKHTGWIPAPPVVVFVSLRLVSFNV